MIFEDLLMVLLDALVVFGVFKVPLLMDQFSSEYSLWIQILSTLVSLYFAVSGLFSESEALNEDRIEYLLTCLKAK